MPALSLAVWRADGLTSHAVDEMTVESPLTYLPGLDDFEHGCWQHFMDSSMNIMAAVDKRLLEAHRLTLVDLLLLDVLGKSDRGARMSELADALGLIPSRVAARICRLEKQQLITRSPSSGDRRGVLPRITFEGREQAARAMTTYVQEIRTHYLDQLSREQMVALVEGCRKINAPLKASGRLARYKRI